MSYLNPRPLVSRLDCDVTDQRIQDPVQVEELDPASGHPPRAGVGRRQEGEQDQADHERLLQPEVSSLPGSSGPISGSPVVRLELVRAFNFAYTTAAKTIPCSNVSDSKLLRG